LNNKKGGTKANLQALIPPKKAAKDNSKN